jgi:hypothetical protein
VTERRRKKRKEKEEKKRSRRKCRGDAHCDSIELNSPTRSKALQYINRNMLDGRMG